LRLISSNLI